MLPEMRPPTSIITKKGLGSEFRAEALRHFIHVVETPAKELERLRRLMNDSVSLERAWHEIRRAGRERYNAAPQATVEALIFSLRERGTKALSEPDTKRRSFELNDQQIIEVGNRLQRLKPEIARAWSTDDVKIFLQARTK